MTYKSRIKIKLVFLLAVAAVVGYGAGLLTALIFYGTAPWDFAGKAPSTPALVGLISMIATILAGFVVVKRSEIARKRKLDG